MTCGRRAIAGTLVVGVAGAVALATPAAADVTVDPSVAARGGPARLAFEIPEERAGAHTTKVELVPPTAMPIAEIYPMSVAGWAPISATRKLDKPIELIHGARTTEVVSAISWTRVGRPVTKPAPATVLTVSLGPVPQAERVAFTLVQTYSDGTVVRWADAPAAAGAKPKHPAPVVTLVDVGPAPGRQGRGTHGGSPQGASTAIAAPLTPGEKAGADGAAWLLGAGLMVLLAFVIEGWILLIVDRRAAGSSSTPAS